MRATAMMAWQLRMTDSDVVSTSGCRRGRSGANKTSSTELVALAPPDTNMCLELELVIRPQDEIKPCSLSCRQDQWVPSEWLSLVMADAEDFHPTTCGVSGAIGTSAALASLPHCSLRLTIGSARRTSFGLHASASCLGLGPA
ncbi:hypothetical protein L1887_52104 [Cichorium endivia]|nr:hypothetical protein L1887_52104 [Cichorium endivia]